MYFKYYEVVSKKDAKQQISEALSELDKPCTCQKGTVIFVCLGCGYRWCKNCSKTDNGRTPTCYNCIEYPEDYYG